MLNGAFLTNFEPFGNAVKHVGQTSKPILRRKQRNKIKKLYANYI